MKKLTILGILAAITGLYISQLQAVCNSGSLTAVAGSPFTVGSTPKSVAYSPLVLGNVFAAVGNSSDATVSMYLVNTSTGTLSAIPGSPFATDLAYEVAFSPLVYGNLFLGTTNQGGNTVSMYQVNTSTGALTTVPGSPFITGSSPRSIAFSPLIAGNVFVAVANANDATISVYKMNTINGALTAVAGSPFASSGANYVAFSPLVSGNLFAAAPNTPSNSVSVYSVNTSTGVFSAVSGSPFAGIGSIPFGIAFSPVLSGNLFAGVTSRATSSVYMFQVNTSTGSFNAVSGSPFATDSGPTGISFSPTIAGNVYAMVTNLNTADISAYKMNTSTGNLTAVSGSPFITGSSPWGIMFSPILSGGIFVADANLGDNNASVFQVNTLIPTITTSSQYILSGSNVTINGSISGGTAPYSITWQDSTVQSGITSTFSRTVSPTSSTIYYIATVTDANGCTAGPSNTVTIGVRTCP